MTEGGNPLAGVEDDCWPYIEKYEAALRDDSSMSPEQWLLDQHPEALRLQLRTLHRLYRPTPPRHAGSACNPANAIPGYEILGELGRGGMGVVYKARQMRLNRVVALKMLLAGAHAGPETLNRFRTEAEAAARLHHPNIVPIHEVAELDGRPYLVLEYLGGGNLKQHLDATPQPAALAAHLVETLARAVHYAHRNGIIHRDLKPANVLLATTEHEGLTIDAPENGVDPRALDLDPRCLVPKITDFGLSKQLAGTTGETVDDPTQSGAVVGTPSYMAPEQASGRINDIGPAVDVYALGAILYEILTGRPPFKAETPLETLLQVQHDEPVPPRSLQPNVPRDLQTICLKCLHKHVPRRYATAEHLADDLHRFSDGRPIHARRSSALERGVKWVRRRPAIAALLAVVSLALMGFVIGGLWHNRVLWEAAERERQKAHDADEQRGIAARQQDLAAAHLQSALDVFEPISLQLNADELAKAPQFEDFRRDFAQRGLIFYQKLLADKDNLDPHVQRQIGRAWHGLGASHAALGEVRQAEDAFRQAVTVQTRLAENSRSEPAWRVDLAVTYQSLGDLYEARKAKEKAADTYAKIVPLFASLPPSIERLSNYLQLSQKLWMMDKRQEALFWATQVIDYLEPMLQEKLPASKRPHAALALAVAFSIRAMMRTELKEWADAIPDYDRALAVKDANLPVNIFVQCKLQRAQCATQLAKQPAK
jgi:serine/threonine protein kinase/tetratricopeptide (TPR) repeat protein